MPDIRIEITRFIGDEPQPGIVECLLIDANGRNWTFIEKTAIVSDKYLDSHSSYPYGGLIACKVISRRTDDGGRSIVLVNTGEPCYVEATTGETRFEVFSEQLAEYSFD